MPDWPAGLPGYFHEDYDPHAFCVPRQYLEDAEAEIDALRRVAEAAERDVTDAKAQCGYHADVPRCYGPQYKRHCTDCPYEVVRETDMALADMALAEWRRVRDLPEREGSGDGGGA